MTTHSAPAPISDEAMALHFDGGTLDRGRAYAAAGRVRLHTATGNSLRSVVEGSGRRTYLVTVSWTQHDGFPELTAACTCPVGENCKHAVATILTSRGVAAGGRRDAGPPDWRQALAGVVDPTSTSPARGATPLALEVTVAEAKPSRFRRETGMKVHVRPLRFGVRGRWVRTGVSWRDISTGYGRELADADPDHVSILSSMLAGSRLAPYYHDAHPIGLDTFGSSLWFHLRRAVDAGIELVGSGGAADGVRLASTPADVTIDLTAADDGAVTLSTVLQLDGAPVELDAERTAILGEPAHGLVHQQAGVLHLVPFAEPVHDGIAQLLVAPPVVVPRDDVDELLDNYQLLLARLAPVGSADGSVTITTTEFDGIALVIERTALDAATLRWKARYRRGESVSDHPLLLPSWPGGPPRDRVAEQATLDALDLPPHLLGQLTSSEGAPRDAGVEGAAVARLFDEVVPWLGDRDGVEVEVSDNDLPALRRAEGDPLISLTVRDPADADTRRTDWFDLQVEVSVDGEPIPFATLFAALSRGDEVMILPSGTWLRLDRSEFAKLRSLIEEARGLADADGATTRINRYQAEWWDELASIGVVEHQSDRWAASVAKMADLAAPAPVEVPVTLDATLRPYQREGLDWLAFLHRNELGGILADDMGLGKTVQTLALCLHVLESEPDARFLVVAPTSVVENWHREAARFAPTMGVVTVRETAARRGSSLIETIGDASMVVTSYALFRIEFDEYSALGWEVLFLDEAQFVKNHQGKTYGCARRLDARTKVAITGTPLENSLMDLWSLLSISAPGLYPDPKRFSEVYRRPIESGKAPELLDTLRRRIAPLMRRRTKGAVLDDLPPKISQTVEVELSARHRRVYETRLQRERQKVLGLVGDVQQHRFEIFKSLTVLRQLSLDPGLVEPEHDGIGSAKLDRLEEDLSQILAEGHRALVFSQFTRYLSRVRDRLDRAGIAHSYLDGRTRDRDAAIERFRSGEVPVFVISLKAGGFGLNLTEADYCFVLDPWWNPAVETQAVDRAHRIGQQNPVFVYRYVSVDTIEEKVTALQARKAALFADVVDADGALSGALSADDIRGLLDLS